MKVYALIPARGGSKRIPKKNLEKIGESSLVEWSIASAIISNMIDLVFVSSDDQDILKIAIDHKECVAIARKGFACGDDATDRDVVVDFLTWLGPNDRPDLIVYLRPTTPFRRIMDIDQAIQKMIDIPAATGLRSVHEMSESAHKCFYVDIVTGAKLERIPIGMVDEKDIDSANRPNHHYPKTYHPNGVVDIIRPEFMMGNPTVLFGSEVIAHITEPTIEIDTPFDLQMARLYHMHRQPDEYEVFK